ncbi:hypothetical protein Poly30_04670 [Planctomycetes bacterium Poly30]|uniref:Nickel uptake substrate-specific transmembrane region n=1 Tax=Saltatorellus ferox TaxID=2528018 RepID=A0A518ELM6_9BACT|nr:hypothetical protein Poly30_04670 [Planctomycetes bacterium Poly30]
MPFRPLAFWFVLLACVAAVFHGHKGDPSRASVEQESWTGPGDPMFYVPDGDATVTLTLRFPEDASDAEKLGLVGKKLFLMGRSELAHGPYGEALDVTVGEDLTVRGSQLHQWIYELSVSGGRSIFSVDRALGPFRVKRDQFFYPSRGEHAGAEIELVRWEDLSGIVVDAAGEPVADARVVASWGRRSIHGVGIREIRRADASGRFLFERMPPEPAVLTAEAEPWERAGLHGDDLREAMKAADGIRLLLEVEESARAKAVEKESLPTTKHTLNGVVSGLSAAELADCIVGFAPTSKVPRDPLPASTMRASWWRRKEVAPEPESGAFVLEGVMWGPTTVWAQISHGSIVRRSERVELRADAETAPITPSIPSPGGVSGKVVLGDGSGLADAVLIIEQTSGSSVLSLGKVTTDAEGAFHLGGLPPGTYGATIENDRFVLSGSSDRAEFTVAAGEVLNDVSLKAVEGGWIDLQILHWTGDPITNFQVEFSVLSHSKGRLRRRSQSATEEDLFHLGPYEPGMYRVQRSLKSVNRHAEVALFRDVEVRAGEVTRVVLDDRTRAFDEWPIRCKGRVLEDGEPVLAAVVRIGDEVGELGRCFTNLEGEFELVLSSAGSFTLEARRGGANGRSASRTVELVAGETMSVDLSLVR